MILQINSKRFLKLKVLKTKESCLVVKGYHMEFIALLKMEYSRRKIESIEMPKEELRM